MKSDHHEGVEFALKLGQALQTHGAPAHRLEEAMREILDLMGIEGHFYSLPTAIFATLRSGGEKTIEILRIPSVDFDLGRLSRLTDLANAVVRREMSPRDASLELDRIITAPRDYGPVLTLVAFALTSAAASRFFRAGLNEMLFALAAGLVVGLLALAADRIGWLGRIFEPTAGLVVSLIAFAGSLAVGASVPIITVAGLIVLVPGFTLTVAVTEIAQKNLVTGSSRLTGAITTFLLLGFGVAVGGSIGAALFGSPASATPRPLPWWSEPVAVVVASIMLAILFRAPRRDLLYVILASAVTVATVKAASSYHGPELGVFAGAFVAGAVSNLYARLLDRPAAVTRVPSMMLLVPGSLGFLSISSLLEQDVLRGLQTAFTVALMAVALVTGLLISNAVVPPGKKL